MAAKLFNPQSLPPADQQAYNAWRARAQSYIGSQGTNGSPISVGGLPAELTYVLVHPEYLKTHPELQQAYNDLTGASLPPSVKSAIQQQLGNNTNFDWRGGQAGVAKHGGVWSQPETWVQLALAGTVGGAAAAGAFTGAGTGGATTGFVPTAAAGGLEEASGVAAPALAGTTTGATTAAGTGMTAGGGLSTTLAAGGKAALLNKYIGKYGPAIAAAGAGISGATQSAAENRRDEDRFNYNNANLELENNRLGLSGYNANTAAQQNFQDQMVTLAKLEDAQRKTGLSNLYKQSVANNPSKSPYNTGSVPVVSDAFKEALANLAAQASGQLAAPPQYNTGNIPKPTYNPYVQPPFTPPTQAPVGTMEHAGNWLGPILSGVGAYYGFNPYQPAAKHA